MDKKSKIRRKTVDLHAPARPSRIRRDPLHVKEERLARDAWWASREWEIRLAILGIILFALGVNAVVFDLGELFSH